MTIKYDGFVENYGLKYFLCRQIRTETVTSICLRISF